MNAVPNCDRPEVNLGVDDRMPGQVNAARVVANVARNRDHPPVDQGEVDQDAVVLRLVQVGAGQAEMNAARNRGRRAASQAADDRKRGQASVDPAETNVVQNLAHHTVDQAADVQRLAKVSTARTGTNVVRNLAHHVVSQDTDALSLTRTLVVQAADTVLAHTTADLVVALTSAVTPKDPATDTVASVRHAADQNTVVRTSALTLVVQAAGLVLVPTTADLDMVGPTSAVTPTDQATDTVASDHREVDQSTVVLTSALTLVVQAAGTVLVPTTADLDMVGPTLAIIPTDQATDTVVSDHREVDQNTAILTSALTLGDQAVGMVLAHTTADLGLVVLTSAPMLVGRTEGPVPVLVPHANGQNMGDPMPHHRDVVQVATVVRMMDRHEVDLVMDDLIPARRRAFRNRLTATAVLGQTISSNSIWTARSVSSRTIG